MYSERDRERKQKKKRSFICFNVIVYLLNNSEISKVNLDSVLLIFACPRLPVSLVALKGIFRKGKKHIAGLQNCSHCLSSDFFFNQCFVGNCGFVCFGDFHFLSLLISGAYKCVQIDSIIGVLAGLIFVIQMRAELQTRFFSSHPPCSVWCW